LGLRLEVFEQERIDLLDGASYLDQTTIEVLPSISFIKSLNYFSLFGGVHRGYTAPSSGALKQTSFSLDTGLDLKSEKSWNKEVGIRSTESVDILDYEFSFFHIDIEDMVAAGRGTIFKNLGKIEILGTETNLLARLDKYTFLPNIHLTHTFLKSNIKDGFLKPYNFLGSGNEKSVVGYELPYCPKNTFLIGIEKTMFNFLSIRVDFKHVDRVYTDFFNLDENYIKNLGIQGPVPSYDVINTSIVFNASDKLSISLIGKNITDEVYIGSRLHSNPSQTEAGMSSGIIPGPRRQINFGINYKF